MYDRVLVRCDADDRTTPAVEHALRLAFTHDATVYVLDRAETTDPRIVRIDGTAIDSVLTTARERGMPTVIEEAGDVSGDVPRDLPVRTLLADCVTAYGIDLVVLPIYGRRSLGEYVFGSESKRIISTATTPVLTVRSDATLSETHPYDSVLVLVDKRTDVGVPVRWGAEIASRYDATLHLVSIVNEAVLGTGTWSNEITDRLKAESHWTVDEAKTVAVRAGVDDIVTTVEFGSTVTEIRSYAADREIDLAVVGTNGRLGFDTSLPGSLGERIVRTAPTPMLILSDTLTDAESPDVLGESTR